jgi:hypothetical protein
MRNILNEAINKIGSIMGNLNEQVYDAGILDDILDYMVGGYYDPQIKAGSYYGAKKELPGSMVRKISPTLIKYGKKYNPVSIKHSESMLGIYRDDKYGLYANNGNEKTTEFKYFWILLDRLNLPYNSFGRDYSDVLRKMAKNIIMDQYKYNMKEYVSDRAIDIINGSDVLTFNMMYATMLSVRLFIQYGKMIEDNIDEDIKDIENIILDISDNNVSDNNNNDDDSNDSIIPAKVKGIVINRSGAALKEPGFMDGLKKVASNLGVNADDMLKVMTKESGLNPAAVNRHSNATGLIQFMPSTARGLGTTVEELRNMSGVEQLKYIELYYKNLGIKPGMDVGDIYILNFYPAAINKPRDYVIASSGSKIYSQNAGLDVNKDGKITVQDVRNWAGAV